jgi:hypothetical protein
MSKRSLAKLTLVLHAVLAVAVAVDAKRRGRSAGTWALVTLLAGLLGVVAYALSGGDEDVPLDELVDRVELE